MVSQRGRNEAEGLVAVVFNGCIYNHRELRSELQDKGHQFLTDHSDTEVLIHGWREWAETLPAYLEGMYAFGIWDRSATRLFLARDAYGEKPLYGVWNTRPSTFSVFGSDARAVGQVEPKLHSKPDSAPATWLSGYLRLGYGYERITP